MNGYIAFLKKEWMEQVRTYRIWILLAVFMILGMLSPLTAKLTPEIIKMVDTGGLEIQIPEPTAVDSYVQFFKNTTFMGFVTLVLVFGGTLTNEYSRGTLINMLTRGLKRSTVIFSKFAMATVLWSCSILLCILLTYGYTQYLFPGEAVLHLPFSVFCLWLFGAFLLAVLLLLSAVCSSSMGVLLGTAVIYVLLQLLNFVPAMEHVNPLLLSTENVALLSEGYTLSSMYPIIGVTLVSIILFLFGAVALFQKKEI